MIEDYSTAVLETAQINKKNLRKNTTRDNHVIRLQNKKPSSKNRFTWSYTKETYCLFQSQRRVSVWIHSHSPSTLI